MGTMLISCTSKRCQRMPPRRFTCAFPASHSSATTEEHWWSSRSKGDPDGVPAAAAESAVQQPPLFGRKPAPSIQWAGDYLGAALLSSNQKTDSQHAGNLSVSLGA